MSFNHINGFSIASKECDRVTNYPHLLPFDQKLKNLRLPKHNVVVYFLLKYANMIKKFDDNLIRPKSVQINGYLHDVPKFNHIYIKEGPRTELETWYLLWETAQTLVE